MRRHGPPELVVGCKHSVIPVPVLVRRRHEIGEPVEKLKRREVNDAVCPRSRGRSRAARADPVGGFVSGEHVADFGYAAACVTCHRESLERKGWPGAVSQQVLQGPHKAGVFEALLDFQARTKLVRFDYDPDDGEVRANAEIGIEDSLFTSMQFNRLVRAVGNAVLELDPVISDLTDAQNAGRHQRCTGVYSSMPMQLHESFWLFREHRTPEQELS